jgi:4-amino-4-deoxy-L-arabinose transferase-like glycosyltransferase
MSLTLPRGERLALAIVLLAAAWLRFQHMGSIEVNIDQVYPIWQALGTLDAGRFPLAGQGTSVLFDNPPLTGYLYLPVVALTRHVLAVYAFTIALNTLAVWLAYRGLRWLLGAPAALAGAALFAANPWIIEDSRRTWVQALAPFFVTLVFWALVPVLTGQSRHPARRTLIALVGLALFAHTYLPAYALVAPVALLILVFWRRVPGRALAAGAAVFAVLLALYAAGLLNHWEGTRGRAEAFAAGETRLSDEALGHALRLVSGGDYADVRGIRAPADDAPLRQDLSTAAHALWTGLIALGVGAALLAWRRAPDRQQRDAALILLVWFALPIALMSYVSRPVHPFYLLLSVPAGHGLAVYALRSLLNRRAGALVAGALIVAVCALNGLNAIRFAQNTAAYPGEDLPETLPLAELTALGERIRAAREPGMAVLAPLDEWTVEVMAGRILRAERLSEFDRALIVPPAGALIVTFQRADEAPASPPLFAEQVEPPLILDDGAIIRLWAVRPDRLPVAHPADVPSDLDVSFVGWTLSAELLPGATADLDLFWRVEALHPDRGIWMFAPFAHLLDASGARLAVADGASIAALDWAPGDLLVYRLAVSVPADAEGPFALRVGLFDGVRARDDGTPGINAIFRLGAEDDPQHAPDIPLLTP